MLKLITILLYIAVMFVEALVITRIILLLINANTSNPFANWVMSMSDMFVQPFDGIVASSLQINTITIPLTPIVALLFYIVAAFILSELLKAFSRD
jgi:uncharacterized protein YggT (Ycf19 family)